MSATIDTWTGGLGLLAGFCAIAAWLLIAGSPADAPSPSASIRLGTLATGELGIAPVGRPILAGTNLRPGRGESGPVHVSNRTPRPLDVAVRTSATHAELDRSAWIEVADGDDQLLHQRLARTRSWSPTTLRLAPGEERILSARVWLPERAADGWQAARGDLMLQFRGRVVGGR